MVHQHDAPLRAARLGGRGDGRRHARTRHHRRLGVGAEHGVPHRGGLELGLPALGVGIGVEEQRRARTHLRGAAVEAHGAQGEARVDVAIEAQHAHRTAVPESHTHTHKHETN